DRFKDQSYFLYRLSQDQLSRVMFPLGDMEKSRVWEMAEDLGLPAEAVAESQEICFVTQGDYRAFLKEEMPQLIREGLIVDREGKSLGRHQGVSFYTVGQRRGLGLSSPERLYVTGLDPDQNRVMVGPEDDLYHQRLIAKHINLIQDRIWDGDQPLRVTAKVRYRSAEAEASARVLGPDRLEVAFDGPQRAVTPGQSVVMYQGEYMVGGGIIERAI
ncbi:MAG: tRNA 2-thiouridine(34) synthase MnmA, partial [Nitrospira sp.]|nr:tRNA 2-thiouridine(34) synthase MnmA [Nitrospira sp.]